MQASNVSFGNVIFKNALPYSQRTAKQRAAQNLILDKFEEKDSKNGLDATLPVSIEDAVSTKMQADILVTQQKDGTIEIKLQEGKDEYDEFGGFYPNTLRGSYLDAKDKKPLIIKTGSSKKKIAKQVDSYISNLRKLCSKYEKILFETLISNANKQPAQED